MLNLDLPCLLLVTQFSVNFHRNGSAHYLRLLEGVYKGRGSGRGSGRGLLLYKVFTQSQVNVRIADRQGDGMVPRMVLPVAVQGVYPKPGECKNC